MSIPAILLVLVAVAGFISYLYWKHKKKVCMFIVIQTSKQFNELKYNSWKQSTRSPKRTHFDSFIDCRINLIFMQRLKVVFTWFCLFSESKPSCWWDAWPGSTEPSTGDNKSATFCIYARGMEWAWCQHKQQIKQIRKGADFI